MLPTVWLCLLCSNLKGWWQICIRKWLWSFSAIHKHKDRVILTSTQRLKVATMWPMYCQQSDATGLKSCSVNLSPSSLLWPNGGGKKRATDCVLFLPPASQTVALTKYPFCAVSFHSDWTNWDLLTANPIRAGTGQSGLGVCHPWHTGLPPPS